MFDPMLIVAIIASLGVLMLVASFIISRTQPSAVEERLGRYADTGGVVGAPYGMEEEKADWSREAADFLNRMLEGTDIFDRISRHLARADIKFRPAEYLIVIAGMGILLFFVGLVLSSSLAFAVLAGIFGFFLPPMFVIRAQHRRKVKFDDQLGDMLNLMVNGLRAGYSNMQAMEAVSRELPAPISTEFRRVVQEMQLGITMEDALDHLLRRIDSKDLDLVVTAINVQREVGGNLAEILDVISYTIRERVRIQGEIRALTAQGRATAWVISLLPVSLMLLLYLLNREYLMKFFNPETRACGIPMLIVAGLMVIAGFAIVQKIVSIDI